MWLCFLLLFPIMCARFVLVAYEPKYEAPVKPSGYDEAYQLIQTVSGTCVDEAI